MKVAAIRMDGLKELDAQFALLERAVATEIVTEALKASADLLAERWRRIAPYNPNSRPKTRTTKAGEVSHTDYGHLRDNIRVRQVRPRKETAVVWKVTTGDAFWAYFYEFGRIGQPPRPTFRPAVEAMKSQLISVQVDILQRGIDAAMTGNSIKGATRSFGTTLANGRNG